MLSKLPLLILSSLCYWIATSTASGSPSVRDHGLKRPNFVFIITDDQDLKLNSLDYLPLVRKHFRNEAHNTNVTDVRPPYGGYPKFISQGLNNDYLPVWLQKAGYNTYYTGKLMNAHSVTNYNNPFVAGWTGADFLLDPYTYSYYNATFQRNKDAPVSHPGEYSTDLIKKKSLEFLEDARKAEQPFFVGIAPIAPHSEVTILPNGAIFTIPIPAERHQNLFMSAKVPRTANFNPKEPSGASWIKRLPLLNATNIESNDQWHRARLETLQAIDELVDEVINSLEKSGLLDNTYVFYTSDNGFHISQHRLQPGKACSIEEDIRIPMFIRGPGIAKNRVVKYATTHTDIVPTIFDLAGISLHDNFDGSPIPLTEKAKIASTVSHEHVNVEFWGPGLDEGKFAAAPYYNNTYKALRVLGKGYDLSYTVWCTNEHEFYDIAADPGQLKNLYNAGGTNKMILGHTISQITSRLDSLLMVLKSCVGQTCIKPWHALHPKGNVNCLMDALNSKYDDFYIKEQPKISFTKCEPGYIVSSEGPQNAKEYSYMDGGNWADWV